MASTLDHEKAIAEATETDSSAFNDKKMKQNDHGIHRGSKSMLQCTNLVLIDNNYDTRNSNTDFNHQSEISRKELIFNKAG